MKVTLIQETPNPVGTIANIENGKFYPIPRTWTDYMFESEVVKEDELELIE